MNIWIVNHYAMPPKYETRVRTHMMAKYLKQKGHSVTVFAASTIHNTDINLITDKKSSFIKQSYEDADFIHVRTSNYQGNGLSRVINMLQFPLRFYRVARKINPKPQVIISNQNSIFALPIYLISRKYDSKLVSEVRDLWPESVMVYKNKSRYNPIIWIADKLQKYILKKSDKVVFTMEGGKDYIIDKKWEKAVDLSKIYYVNNGVDLDSFNFNKDNYATEDSDLEDSNTFKVVYTGSIRPANNVRKIVDVAEATKLRGGNHIKFLIYGDGPDREILEKHCHENDITNVVFKGQVEKKEIPYILSKCDLNIMHFKQSRLKKYGTSMNKVFEYLASGKPSLSDCEFGYDIFNKYKAGWSIDNASAEELADKTIEISNMSLEEYDAYCENALVAAKDFDYKILMNRFEDLVLKSLTN